MRRFIALCLLLVAACGRARPGHRAARLFQCAGRRQFPDRAATSTRRAAWPSIPPLPITDPDSARRAPCLPMPGCSTSGACRPSSTSSCPTPGWRERRVSPGSRSSATVDGFARSALPTRRSISTGRRRCRCRSSRTYQQDLIVGASLQVSVPRDSTTRRRVGEPRHQPLVVQARDRRLQGAGPLTLEGTAAVTFFTDNTDFLGGRTAIAGPALRAAGPRHLQLRRGVWASLDIT